MKRHSVPARIAASDARVKRAVARTAAKRRKENGPLREYTPDQWARMPPVLRTAANRLRELRGLPVIQPPAVDRSLAPPPAPARFDHPAARRLARADGKGRLADRRELLAFTESILNAIDGDTKALTTRLRRGATLPEQRLAADLFDGKIRRKANRPDEERVKLKRGLFVVAAHLLETLATGRRGNWSNEKLFTETVKHFTDRTGLSRTVMHKIFSELKAKRLSPQHLVKFIKRLRSYSAAEPDVAGEGFTINDTLI
jgi:hypothetical protein